MNEDDATDLPPGGSCGPLACVPGFPGAPIDIPRPYSQSITSGDLNGDGKPDFVIVVLGGLNVLLGAGNDTFAPALEYLPAAGVQSVAVGDLNGDGHLDLAVTRPGPHSSGLFLVTVLFNGGNGTFTYGGDFAADVGVYGGSTLTFAGAVTVGDVDGDGKPDLAVTSTRVYGEFGQFPPIPWSASSSLKVLLNSGNGTFAPAVSHALWSGSGTGSPPFAVVFPLATVMGDLDGDGKLDVAVANAPKGAVSVLLNGGNGTFAAAVDHATGPTYSLAMGDVNGDGKADLVAGLATSAVTVLQNSGNGTFAPAVTHAITDPHPDLLQFVALGDMNGDGSLDIVSAGDSYTVSVVLNDGTGTFAPSVPYPCGKAMRVALADLDGNGSLDIALPDRDQVLGLLNSGNGTFPRNSVDYPVGSKPRAVAVGDLNGDGKPDLAVVNYYGSSVSVLLGDGQGGFSAGADLMYELVPNGGGEAAALADLNGDGSLDVVVLTEGSMNVLLNLGNGVFAPVVVYVTHSSGFPPALGVVDLNGDGALDLVNANGSVLLNHGDGMFADAIDNDWNSEALALGDFDGDGFPDAAIADHNDNVNVMFNDGQGSFSSPVVYDVYPDRVVSLASWDLNGDGKLDLLTRGGSVLFNTGAGAFGGLVHNDWGFESQDPGGAALILGDVDGDGVPDAILPEAGAVTVALEKSNGASSAVLGYPVGSSLESSGAAADLDGNGKLDIVVTNSETDTVSVLLNSGCLP